MTTIITCGTEALRSAAIDKGVTLLLVPRGRDLVEELLDTADWVAYEVGGRTCEVRPVSLAGRLALSLMLTP